MMLLLCSIDVACGLDGSKGWLWCYWCIEFDVDSNDYLCDFDGSSGGVVGIIDNVCSCCGSSGDIIGSPGSSPPI